MSLAKHIETQQRVLQQLIDLLEQERRVLIVATIDGQKLAELATAKQILLIELERLESQRHSDQIELGYGEGRQAAERAAMDAGCQIAWRRMRELSQRAKRLNQFNGDNIRSRLRLNQRLLNFLHEAAGHSLYGPDGRSRRQSLSGLTS